MWLVVMTLCAALDAPGNNEALALAREREAAGDDVGARRVLEAGVQASPTWALGRLELGRLVLKAGSQPELAEFHLDVARALIPENPRAQYLYALAVEERGRPAEARQALETCLALREDFAEAWYRLAGLRFSAGDWNGAMEAYAHFLKHQPADTGARLQLAMAQERAGQLPAAEQTLRALLGGPARVIAARRLGDLLDRNGRPSEAAQVRQLASPPAPKKRALLPSSR